MSKVITFSRVFPSYHPLAGLPTYFVEKFLNWYWDQSHNPYHNVQDMFIDLNGHKWDELSMTRYSDHLDREITEWKSHTIRAGHRFKAGEFFKPCVWSAKPYRSKMIQFAPDIQVKKVWDFDAHGTNFFLSGKHEITHPEGFDFSEVEMNDGLGACELMGWICLSPEFKKTNTFAGQIICWNESIEY